MTIEQEIFAVLTDTFHKPGFKLHVLVLQHLFCLVFRLLMPSFSTLWLYLDPGFSVGNGKGKGRRSNGPERLDRLTFPFPFPFPSPNPGSKHSLKEA